MKIRDIVNRDIVNLENCEQEPIHIPGSIQPHGFLLGITRAGFTIDFCSGNTNEYISLAHNAILGKTFGSVFSAWAEESLKSYLADEVQVSSRQFILQANNKSFVCNVHSSGDVYVLEAEQERADRLMPDTYEQTRLFLTYLAQSTTLQQLCASVAANTREITGYDRVMIYRFDEEYNGEIFAESCREDLEPFLGLHYPHSDIPAQARELYMRNLLRLIPDIGYTPVPLYTIDDKKEKNLDLSLSTLRSVSPIHVQYLQNMGVGATLTISLIHKGRLWGLIACHHYSAKNLSPSLRIAAQLQGHFITSQIDVRQSNEEYDVARKANEALERLLALSLPNTRDSFRKIVEDNNLLEVCNATSAAVMVGGELFSVGKEIPESVVRSIAAHFSPGGHGASFVTNCIAEEVPGAGEYADVAAGLICHSISVNTEDCILWFREESISQVSWGGDPNKAIIKDENGLHPRKSFDLWRQIVKGKSNPWLQPELNAAANYAHSLEKHLTMLIITEEEEKYRKLSEVLKASNEELENINWISAHDLQEPLRKIQMMSSRILAMEEQLSPKAAELIQRMNVAARKMQSLLRNILDFVKIKNADRLMEHVDLQSLVSEATLELAEQINEKNATIKVDQLPEITAIPFLVKQLLVNLISNSLKFSDPGRQQTVSISAALVNGEELGEAERQQYHRVSIADTGIGFDEEYAESIFKIFTRLYSNDDYEGTGVGLALCRKIMQSHDGYIRATGRPDGGATFYLYFPIK
jgi:chemotaxis family two-component system sensor kinase Cph1